MQSVSYRDIMQLPSRYRAQLMNKVSGLKAANLIGTKSNNGRTNLAIFNSVTHIGANPPYLGFVLRPTTVERHTYENIKETGVYTINQITTQIHQQAHQTSAKYNRNTSEFESVGLTEYYHDDFTVPFVAESHIKIGLQFEEEQYIKCNDTRLVIGRVEQLILSENHIAEDGHLDFEALDGIAIGGLDTYYTVKQLGRFGYAKP